MIYGIGIDLVNIKRMERVINRWGDRFIGRVFTPEETEICYGRPSPPSAFALRFGAKEAFSKAIGMGMTQGVRWVDIWIENDERGAPHLKVSGKAAQYASALGTYALHVSLSHSHTVAAATVVLEGEPPEESPLPME